MYSFQNLKDVIILASFVLAMFSLLGTQLCMGALTRICIVDFNPVDVNGVINDSTSDYADVNVMNWIQKHDLIHWKYSNTGYNETISWKDWVKNKTTWYVTEEYSSHSDGYI